MFKTYAAGVAVLAVLASSHSARAQAAPAPPAAPLPVDRRPMEMPRKPAGGAVTLTEAVRRALERNPTSEIAHQEVVRSIALARQARAAWLPALNANGTYTHLDDDRRLANGSVALPQDSLAANLQLTVPLLAPRQWVSSQRAKENIAATRATAWSKSYRGLSGSPDASSMERPAIPVAAARTTLTSMAAMSSA